MLEISEPVNVWVFFKGNILQPYVFFWRGRRIVIDKINLVHTSKEGENTFYHFSISAGANFYKLVFELPKMTWQLEAVEEGE